MRAGGSSDGSTGRGSGTSGGRGLTGPRGSPSSEKEGGEEKEPTQWLEEMTPRQIVAELDRYIIGQSAAKKAVAIALRNRWRRQRVGDELRDEILPNNLILIGPTGVGKTEIARRLARLAGAPFVKVEASKFTEVGYVGRDVESMIRDLVDTAVNLVRGEREEEVEEQAEAAAEERLLDLLFPPVKSAPVAPPAAESTGVPPAFVAGPSGVRIVGEDSDEAWERFATDPSATVPGVESVSGGAAATPGAPTPAAAVSVGPEGVSPLDERRRRTREKLRALLRDGKLEDRLVEVEVQQSMSLDGMMIPMGMDGMDHNFAEMLQEMLPKKSKKRSVKVSEARRLLVQEELDRLVDMEEVVNEALDRAEETGIVFLDEIDKVAGERGSGTGPDISREGVQRDLLPVVEGSNVQTKYGLVRTDHILFIAAGAFHVSKPSDLIPELQGRFPIRVELRPLEEADFVRILTEPKNALIRQYRALIEAEGSTIRFEDDGIREVARIAFRLNERMENIGARRLQTVMTTLLEHVLFELPDGENLGEVVVDGAFVTKYLAAIVEDEDLRRYIL